MNELLTDLIHEAVEVGRLTQQHDDICHDLGHANERLTHLVSQVLYAVAQPAEVN